MGWDLVFFWLLIVLQIMSCVVKTLLRSEQERTNMIKSLLVAALPVRRRKTSFIWMVRETQNKFIQLNSLHTFPRKYAKCKAMKWLLRNYFGWRKWNYLWYSAARIRRYEIWFIITFWTFNLLWCLLVFCDIIFVCIPVDFLRYDTNDLKYSTGRFIMFFVIINICN
jgi:hypothetical protein